jgi:uncharacterized protein (UPF0147 family)
VFKPIIKKRKFNKFWGIVMSKLFILISMFAFMAQAQEMKCDYDKAINFLETIVGENGTHSPKDINKCLNQNVQHLQNTYGNRFVDTGDAIVILPERAGDKAVAWKYRSENANGEWGADKVFIRNSILDKGNWSAKSGGRRLRDDPQVIDALNELGIPLDAIEWHRDRKDVFISTGEGSQCQRKRCGRRSSWDPIACECVDRTCENKEEKENSCLDQNQEGVHNYEIEFTYSFNEKLCKCEKEKNEGFIPPRKRSCAPTTEEYVQKQKDCAEKTDPERGVSFELNDDCKCEKTKTFCDGKLTKSEYQERKTACKEAEGDFIDCECQNPGGEKQCFYKEKRRFAGDLFSHSMRFNGSDKSQEHFANEAPPRYGPCDMENWLATIGSERRDIDNCKNYEKLKIKKRGEDAGDNFTTKRFLCSECKSGFDPVETETNIDGVNDDWMEQSHMSYISACVESDNKCVGKRFERREKRCQKKNNDPDNVARGITFTWNKTTCKCEKDKEEETDTDEVPEVCMDKVSNREIRRCLKIDGYFDEQTCECQAPCYEILGREDTYDTGEKTCRYLGSEIIDATALEDFTEENTNAVEEGQCDEVIGGRSNAEKIKALQEKCIEQMAQEGQEGVQSKTVNLDIQLSEQVQCKLSRTYEGAGFADKIPGLVGGLDLDKDFVNSNGSPLTLPEGIIDADDFCSKNTIKYKPQNNPYDGNFKTSSLNGNECKNVVDIYNDVKKKAMDFVGSIESEELTVDQKAELLSNGFNSSVTASANRVPHGPSAVNHTELSQQRADSMNTFYKEEVINSITDPQLKAKVSEMLAGHNGVSNNISYFGPQYASNSSSIAKWAPKGDPSAAECMQLINLTEDEKKVPRSQANDKIKAEMKKYYDCTVDYHVNQEIENLRLKSEELQTNTAQNFSAAIRKNPIFVDYAAQNNIDAENFDIFNNKDEYASFLKTMYNRSVADQKELLNSMKIFDIDVSAGGGINYTQEVLSDINVTCKVNYQDLYAEDPVLQTVDVLYGKRPGFFRRMNRECIDEHRKLIDELQEQISGQNLALKDELIDRFGEEKGTRKFNRKMRRQARKEWRKSKRNTRQVRKNEDGSAGWQRQNRDDDNGDIFDGIRDGSVDPGDLRQYESSPLNPGQAQAVDDEIN